MPDRNKVIAGLTHCKSTWMCNGCPYYNEYESEECKMFDDAIDIIEHNKALLTYRDELIAAQEAEINRLKSILNIPSGPGTCSAWRTYHGEQRCYGTKEIEPCSCNGNKEKCDFYPPTMNFGI